MVKQYLIRAIKYLVFIFVFFCILVVILYYAYGLPARHMMPWDLFKGNETQLIIFFAVFALIYPAIGYGKKEVPVGNKYGEHRNEVIGILGEGHFTMVNEENDSKTGNSVMTFHHRNRFIRLMRLYEDAVILRYDKEMGTVLVTGLRKDVVRFAHNIEWLISNAEDQDNK